MLKLTRYRSLFSYQRSALQWAAQYNRVALFLEMRLGKTIVALRWAKAMGAERILVLCPLSVFSAWERELALERIPFYLLRGPDRFDTAQRRFLSGERFAGLLNHELSIRSRDILALNWDAVILDESDAIRNPKTKLSKILTASLKHVPMKAILSGLPNPESPLDFFQQFKFLHGAWLGFDNFYEWRFKRCEQADYFGHDWQPTKETQLDIQNALTVMSYRLSRKEAGIGERKVREIRTVPINAEQKRAHHQAIKKFMIDMPDGSQWSTRWVLPRLNAAHRIAGGFLPDGTQISSLKIQELMRLLRGELKRETCVVWFRFNKELHAVRRELKRAKIGHTWLVGQTDRTVRAGRIARFQAGQFRIMLCQTACAFVGLDFSVADTAIYFSNYFSHRIRQQSEDRIIHPEKKVPLLYLDLCTEHTEDADIVELLRDKHLTSRRFLGELIKRLK